MLTVVSPMPDDQLLELRSDMILYTPTICSSVRLSDHMVYQHFNILLRIVGWLMSSKAFTVIYYKMLNHVLFNNWQIKIKNKF